MAVSNIETAEHDVGNLGLLLSSLNSGVIPSGTTYRDGRQTRIRALEEALPEIRSGLAQARDKIAHGSNSESLTPEQYDRETAPLKPYSDALSRASDILRIFETGRANGRKVAGRRWSKGKTHLPPHEVNLRKLRDELYDTKRIFDSRYRAWQSGNIGTKVELEKRLHQATLSSKSDVKGTLFEIYSRLENAYESLRNTFDNFSADWLQRTARILGTEPEPSSVINVLRWGEDELQTIAMQCQRECVSVKQYVEGEIAKQGKGVPYTLSKGNTNGLLATIRRIEAQVQDVNRVFDGSQEHIRTAMHTVSKLDGVLAQASSYQSALSKVQANLGKNNFEMPETLYAGLSAGARTQAARDLSSLGNYKSAQDYYQPRIAAAFNLDGAVAQVREAYQAACERMGAEAKTYLAKTIESRAELSATRTNITNLLSSLDSARQFRISGVVDTPNQVVSGGDYSGLKEFGRVLHDAERSLAERADDSSVRFQYSRFSTAMRMAQQDRRLFPTYFVGYTKDARDALTLLNEAVEQSQPRNVDPRVANLFTARQPLVTIDPAQVALLEQYEREVATASQAASQRPQRRW